MAVLSVASLLEKEQGSRAGAGGDKKSVPQARSAAASGQEPRKRGKGLLAALKPGVQADQLWYGCMSHSSRRGDLPWRLLAQEAKERFQTLQQIYGVLADPERCALSLAYWR